MARAARKIDTTSQSSDLFESAETKKQVQQDSSLLGAKQEVRLITPEDARQLLEDARVDIGDLDRKRWEKYRDDMIEGRWYFNGVGIGLGDKEIIRGKNRLKAVVESGKAQHFLVAWDLNSRILMTMRQHMQRNFRSYLEVEKFAEPGVVSRTLHQAVRYDRGIFGLDRPIGWDVMLLTLENNPEIQRGVLISSEHKKSKVPRRIRPLLCAMALKAGHEDALIKLLAYSSLTESKAGESSIPTFHPARVLQSLYQRKSVTKFHACELLASSIMALNDIIEGHEQATSQYDFPASFVKGPRKNWPKSSVLETYVDVKKNPNFGIPNLIGFEGFKGTKGSGNEYSIAERIKTKFDASDTGELPEAEQNPRSEVATITPEIATIWLEKNNKRNRNVKQINVDRIIRDIEAGRIAAVNTESIAFDKTGIIVNGQHRLEAIRQSGIPVDMTVVYGAEPQALNTYDQEKPQTIGDDTGKLTQAQIGTVNAAAALFWREDVQKCRPWEQKAGRPSNLEIDEAKRRHPAMYQAVLTDQLLKKNDSMTNLTSGLATYFIARGMEEDPKMMAAFTSYMESSANIPADHFFHKMRDDLAKFSWSKFETQWKGLRTKAKKAGYEVDEVSGSFEDIKDTQHYCPKTKKHFMLIAYLTYWSIFKSKQAAFLKQNANSETEAQTDTAGQETESVES